MKKILALIAMGLLISFMAVGCGSDDTSSEKNTGSSGNLSTFTAQDMEGNTITQDILKDYDITMINVWATWCGYCITEMPELQEVSETAPANANVITICVDAPDNMELAQQILADNNVTFTTLAGNPELGNKLTNYVRGFPTTVCVDSEGNLIGKPVSGVPARGDAVAEAYLSIIDERLAMVEA